MHFKYFLSNIGNIKKNTSESFLWLLLNLNPIFSKKIVMQLPIHILIIMRHRMMNTFLVSSSNLAFASLVVNVLFTLRSSMNQVNPPKRKLVYFRNGGVEASLSNGWCGVLLIKQSRVRALAGVSVVLCYIKATQ